MKLLNAVVPFILLSVLMLGLLSGAVRPKAPAQSEPTEMQKSIADELAKLKVNITSNGNLVSELAVLTETIRKQTEEVNQLKVEVLKLKTEVSKGISLIPASLKKVTEQDPTKTAVIETINDKLTDVAEKAATKEDIERLKTSVLRAVEDGQSVKPVTVEKKDEPTTPQVVLPQLSEEFPKK